MRIALLNIDSLASNASTRAFIERHASEIALVALSPAFRKENGGFPGQTWRHLVHSGTDFSNFLAVLFLLPRLARRVLPRTRSIRGVCADRGIRVEDVTNVKSESFHALLRDLEVDLVVTSFFDQILPPELIALPRLGVVNVHISPLPEHRGPMPVIHGLAAETSRLGVSVHRIEAGIDTGPLLDQKLYQAPPRHSVLEMMQHLQSEGLEMVSALLPKLAAGTAAETPQSGGSYQGFPSRSVIASLKRNGRALFRLADIRRALATAAEP